MPTTTDFVKWKLEGPNGLPMTEKGYQFVGRYYENTEVFYNAEENLFYCKSADARIGRTWTAGDILVECPEHYGRTWEALRQFVKDYLACRQQPTS